MSDAGTHPAPSPRSGTTGYIVALALTSLVTLVGIVIFGRGGITNVGLLYLLPVMVAATQYGLRPGLVAGLASSLAYNFFFIPPTRTFTIQDPQNIVSVLVLLGVAVMSSQLAAQVREQALLAQDNAEQNSALAGFARLLTGLRRRDDLSRVTCVEIARLFDVKAVVLMHGTDSWEPRASVPKDEPLELLDLAAARWVGEHNRPAGRGSDALTASEWLFQPISAGDKALAVFGLARSDAGPPIRADQLPLLLSLLDQAGLALERIALEEEMAQLSQIKERDRLRHALLSSVSHDLRTPLTTVLGTLQDLKATNPEQAGQLATARAEAERLHRFVGNLLDMVRIEAGALHHTTEPVDMAEAIAAAVHDLRCTLDHPIDIEIAPDLPFVLVDPQLFHHCLINLLENATKHGDPGAPIAITAGSEGHGLTLSVIDQGPGLPAGEEARLFETFTRIEGSDRKGGTGLGLAIVKGFTEAMGLNVVAANRIDRPGARFTIYFDAAHIRIASET